MDPLESPAPAAPLSALRRLSYGLGGLLLLAFMTLFSLGTALLAPLGIGVGAGIARMRGGRLSPLVSWLVAVATCSLLLGIGAAALLLTLPDGTLEEAIRQAQTQPQPEQPEWLERLNPNAGTPAAPNPAVTLSSMFLGVAMGCVMIGAWGGTGGWAATLLVASAVTGRPLRSGGR